MLSLPEQEKQEIVRYLESDQASSEKYRFLLFEDKRWMERQDIRSMQHCPAFSADRAGG